MSSNPFACKHAVSWQACLVCWLAFLVHACSAPLQRSSRSPLPLCRACRLANDLADLLAPQSGAYYDVWLDGEKFYAHTMEVGSSWLLQTVLPASCCQSDCSAKCAEFK